MKKLFITFILIILFSANAIAEVRKQTLDNGYYIGEFNSNNQRHGYGIYYFDTSKLICHYEESVCEFITEPTAVFGIHVELTI